MPHSAGDEDRDATGSWVRRWLSEGERVEEVVPLLGGWTSHMRRLDLRGPGGRRSLVLRSFVRPFYVRHAEGLLTREAAVLRLLAGTDVPAPALTAVDPTARHCAHPSLLMSLLPGRARRPAGAPAPPPPLRPGRCPRAPRRRGPADPRPRTYQAWTSPERVVRPPRTGRPGLWQRAVDVIAGPPPPYRGCFLHRDFHPGNVLFTGTGAGLRVTGVVDWVETSWGPADLDVAHCSAALALLHGVPAGMRFVDRYVAAGGTVDEDDAAHLHWRLLDALGHAPDAEKVAVPWRRLGRSDLTPEVLTRRLEEYLAALFDRYG
ncbi:phosphotransferase family protein [Streptomyces albidoflavus]